MSEVKWLSCPDSRFMLRFLKGAASDSKMRLFACACCRRVWRHLRDKRLAEVVGTLEEIDDGPARPEVLESCSRLVADALAEIRADRSEQRWHYAEEAAAMAVAHSCGSVLTVTSLHEVIMSSLESLVFGTDRDEGTVSREDGKAKAVLLRDIFNNPFSPVTLNPSWLTPAVANLARSIYEGRSFDRLPELGDVLEAAGCRDGQVLSHCRSRGGHVRGCWVVDLVLGRR